MMSDEDPNDDLEEIRASEARLIVHEAMQHAPSERRAFIESCEASPAVLRHAYRLLDGADPTTEDRRFDSPLAARLEARAGNDEADDHHSPERVGPWELRRRIGRGGMADVWLAARADGLYRRRVAIKRLHPGLSSREVIARFERERQILAGLSHEGIARMLEAGIDSKGGHYIVMEYVDGTRIDEYADERHLSVRARVELVAKVADATMAAHQLQIVHRDIKPSNVLVDDAGDPVLLDFGVSKVLDPERDVDTLVTQDASRYLTPNYASPEQFGGATGHVDGSMRATSDVYSLGVLSYELLTGSPPLALQGRSAFDAQRALNFDPPPRLADSVNENPDKSSIARSRGTTPARLALELRDKSLEAVVAAALRKEPARRPPDAGAFRDELERWLSGKAVLSRRDSWIRAARRTIGRHRLAFALGASLLLALLAGFVLVAAEARRTRTANTLLELEAEKAARANEQLAAESQINAEQLVYLRDATRALLRDSVQTFGGVPGAERGVRRMIRKGVAIAKRQSDPELQALLGQTLVDLEVMESIRRGPTPDAVQRIQNAVDMAAAAAGPLGGNVFPCLPHIRSSLGAQQMILGQLDEADATLREAQRDADQLMETGAVAKVNAAGSRTRVARQRASLLSRQGRFDDAALVIDDALAALDLVREQVPGVRIERASDAVDSANLFHIERQALMDLEATLVRLRAGVAPAGDHASELDRAADLVTRVTQSHGDNLAVRRRSRRNAYSIVRSMLDEGQVDAAAERFESTSTWQDLLPRIVELELDDLESIGEETCIAIRIATALGGTGDLPRAALEQAEEQLGSQRFVQTYYTQFERARWLTFMAWHDARRGRSAAAAALLGAAKDSLEDLCRRSPRDFETAAFLFRVEARLLNVLQDEGWSAKERTRMEALLGSMPGDERARGTLRHLLR